MRLRHVSIKNFRGIQTLDWSLSSRFAVLLGPGDSGKSSVLEAIALALTSRWNPPISDADFLDGDPSKPFSIEVTLSDLPADLIREDHFGHWLRGVAPDGSLHDEPEAEHDRAITIRLEVDQALEPRWAVVRETDQDGIRISANQRAAIGMFLLDGSTGQHLRWSRDSALVRLGDTADIQGTLIDAHRAARTAVFNTPSQGLAAAASAAASAVEAIGGASLARPRPGLDPAAGPRATSLVLHDGDVPATNLGMGTQRLAGMAFQLAALESQAVVLIDELEIGLEPHRLLHVIRRLKERADDGHGQVIVTTHSPVVVVGVDVTDLHIVRRGSEVTTVLPVPATVAGLGSGEPQATARSGAAAMLARRIVVCEGKTEVGICRALFRHWDDAEPVPAALKGTVFRDGRGNDAPVKAQCLAELGYATALLADSDLSAKEKAANEARIRSAVASGVVVFRWDPGLALEDQIAASLPRDGMRSLIALAVELNDSEDPEAAVLASVAVCLGRDVREVKGLDPVAWTRDLGLDGASVRIAIGQASRQRRWFKSEDRGERLGALLAGALPALKDNDTLRTTLESLRRFVYDHPPAGEAATKPDAE
jgi:putative ATP-dependent endonuclease of OLD family